MLAPTAQLRVVSTLSVFLVLSVETSDNDIIYIYELRMNDEQYSLRKGGVALTDRALYSFNTTTTPKR